MAHRHSRRDFLKSTAAAGAGYFALAGLTPGVSRAANEKIRIAGIGGGGKGHSDILQAANHGDGVIRPVTEVHVWTNRPIWPQAPKVTKRPEGKFDVPKHVHWDLFLGTAPERPYAPGYHPFSWRGWWDFGTGALGDMACHTANMAFMALKLGLPTSVVAESGEINPETYPAWAAIHYEFPARGEMPPVRLTWYEGRREGKKVL